MEGAAPPCLLAYILSDIGAKGRPLTLTKESVLAKCLLSLLSRLRMTMRMMKRFRLPFSKGRTLSLR